MTKITNAGGGLVIVTSVHKSKNKQKQYFINIKLIYKMDKYHFINVLFKDI